MSGINEEYLNKIVEGVYSPSENDAVKIHDHMCDGFYLEYLDRLIFSTSVTARKLGLFILSEIDPKISNNISKSIKRCLFSASDDRKDAAIKTLYDHFYYKIEYKEIILTLIDSNYYTTRENSFLYSLEMSLLYPDEYKEIFGNKKLKLNFNSSVIDRIRITNFSEKAPRFNINSDWINQCLILICTTYRGEITAEIIEHAKNSKFEIIRDWANSDMVNTVPQFREHNTN